MLTTFTVLIILLISTHIYTHTHTDTMINKELSMDDADAVKHFLIICWLLAIIMEDQPSVTSSVYHVMQSGLSQFRLAVPQ